MALRVFRILTPRQRVLTVVVTLVGLVANALELFGITLLIPTIAILLSKETPDWFQDFPILTNLSVEEAQISLLCGVVLMFVIKNIVSWCAMFAQLKYSTGIATSLRDSVFQAHINEDFEKFIDGSNAERIRTVENATSIAANFLSPIMLLLIDGVYFVGALTLIFLVNPVGTFLVVLTLGLAIFSVQKLTSERLHRWGESKRLAEKESLSTMSEAFNAFKEMRLTGSASFFVREHSEALRTQRSQVVRFGILAGTSRYLLEIVGLATLLVFATLGGLLNNRSTEAIAALTFLGAVLIRSLPVANRVLASLQSIRFGLSTVQAVAKELEKPKHTKLIKRTQSSLPLMQFNSLEAIEIDYTFPNASEPSIRNCSMRIERGDRIAVVGPSGSGKSTLLEVLLGLRIASRGRIECNGRPLLEIQESLWTTVGYVPQYVALMNASVEENIALGADEASLDLERLLWLNELIRLPRDLFSGKRSVGDAGVAISGGQRQRIGLARALYRRPQLLILDESTSHVDSETKVRILDAVDNLDSEITVIHVTHDETVAERCSTIMRLTNK